MPLSLHNLVAMRGTLEHQGCLVCRRDRHRTQWRLRYREFQEGVWRNRSRGLASHLDPETVRELLDEWKREARPERIIPQRSKQRTNPTLRQILSTLSA